MARESVNRFRERVNLKLFNSKVKADKLYERTSFFIVFMGLFSFLFYHGFPQDSSIAKYFNYSFSSLLGFQAIKFILGYLYNFKPREYFSDNILEIGILLLSAFHSIIHHLGFNIEVFIAEFFEGKTIEAFDFSIYSQVYFFLIFLIELGRVSSRIPKIKMSPPALLISSFVVLIFVGAFLLMLPNMTVQEGSMPFFDALFTSTSASCVTGLIVVDTATYFTLKGQFIIMMLIQLGGLNIISFALIFAFLNKRSVGIKQQSLIRENFDVGDIRDSKKLLKKVFILSFTIELIGSVILFFSWENNSVFNGLSDKVFDSIFHSISAFNNAGFSTFQNGLAEDFLKDHMAMQYVISFLIILGSTGFTVLHELFSWTRIKKFIRRERQIISLNSKIGLYTSLILLTIGSISFLILENNNTLQGMGVFEKISNAFFQATTTRTAGFNTVDISQIGFPMLLIMMMLMYIGASPASTGGGIKTNTFALLFISVFATIRGKRNIEISKKMISFKSLNKALLVFLFSITVIFISLLILSISDSHIDIISLAFEEISAFATVGLTRGITSDLSVTGRTVIMFSMFIGRIGLLTLVYSMGLESAPSKYQYTKAKIIIG